jgi:hypothetical protein
MTKDAIIKYLPNDTTQEEIKRIRSEFNTKDVSLILIISGKGKLLNCLEELINVD